MLDILLSLVVIYLFIGIAILTKEYTNLKRFNEQLDSQGTERPSLIKISLLIVFIWPVIVLDVH